jgi:hypothetical protein
MLGGREGFGCFGVRPDFRETLKRRAIHKRRPARTRGFTRCRKMSRQGRTVAIQAEAAPLFFALCPSFFVFLYRARASVFVLVLRFCALSRFRSLYLYRALFRSSFSLSCSFSLSFSFFFIFIFLLSNELPGGAVEGRKRNEKEERERGTRKRKITRKEKEELA